MPARLLLFVMVAVGVLSGATPGQAEIQELEPAVAAGATSREALVIGNAAYDNIGNLANARRDAGAIALRLQSLGFRVILGLDSDHEETAAAIETFIGRLTEDTEAVVYFSGHGVRLADDSYLLPSDMPSLTVSQVERLDQEAFGLASLLGPIAAADPRAIFVIFDACGNNPLGDESEDGLDAGGGTGLLTEYPQNLAILYAASPGQVAYDGAAGGYGIFTGRLLEAMDEPMPIATLATRVTGAVTAYVESYGEEQTPLFHSTMREDYWLVPPPSRLLATDGPVTQSTEKDFWQRATAEADDLMLIEAYLALWPEGLFADQAAELLLAANGVAEVEATPAAPDPETVPRLVVGEAVSGVLTPNDPLMPDGTLYHCYLLAGEAGETVFLAYSSDNLDPWIAAGPRSEFGCGEQSYPFHDDDSGVGRNALLELTFDRSEDYVVIANTFAESEAGPYLLQAFAGAAIGPGETVQGELDSADTITSSTERRFDCYVYWGTAGEVVQIDLQSQAIDTYLLVGSVPRGGCVDEEIELLYLNDDYGGGTNSRLNYGIAADGPLLIAASSFGAGELGPYTLSVTAAPPGLIRPERISIGATVNGALDEDDPVDGLQAFDCYIVSGRAGQTLTIALDATGFDAFLDFGPGETCLTNLPEFDDDSGGDFDARLETTLSADGTYAIRVSDFLGTRSGTYTLTVTE